MRIGTPGGGGARRQASRPTGTGGHVPRAPLWGSPRHPEALSRPCDRRFPFVCFISGFAMASRHRPHTGGREDWRGEWPAVRQTGLSPSARRRGGEGTEFWRFPPSCFACLYGPCRSVTNSESCLQWHMGTSRVICFPLLPPRAHGQAPENTRRSPCSWGPWYYSCFLSAYFFFPRKALMTMSLKSPLL